MSYSLDFRRCVVENVMSGMPWEEAMRVFKISRNSIGNWCRQLRKTGVLSPPPRKTSKIRKVDIAVLKQMIATNSDATLEELAEPFGVYPSTIDYHLRKLKITRKKNYPIRGERRGKRTKIPSRNRADRSRRFGVPG